MHISPAVKKKKKTDANAHLVSTAQAPPPARVPQTYTAPGLSTLASTQTSDTPIIPAVATNQPAPVAVTCQPFADREAYICPFFSKGLCNARVAFYDTYRKLCGHVVSDHKMDGLATSYTDDPFRDGTLKVPCPRGCGTNFVCHQQANQHSKSSACPQPKRDKITCSWPKCPFVADGKDPEKGMANHVRAKHSRDDTSPHQCSKCSEYYHYDLYKLAMHEERCTTHSVATAETAEDTTMRFRLNEAAKENQPPTYIIVVRSSNKVLEGWKAGTDSYRTGLPILGKRIVAHFAAKIGRSDKKHHRR